MTMANKMNWLLVFSGVMALTAARADETQFPADLSAVWLQTLKVAAEMPTPPSRPVNDGGALNMEVQTKDLVAFVNTLSKEEQDAVISKTASMMGGYFKNGDYRRTEEVLKLLTAINADSGYAYYFGGEVKRKTGHSDQSHLPFEKYVAHEKTLSARVSKTGSGIKECSKDALGYCQQRTAWICHLLANDYFAMSAKAPEAEKNVDLLRKAAVHAQCVLDNYPPKGFEAIGSLLQSAELQVKIKTALAHLLSQYR